MVRRRLFQEEKMKYHSRRKVNKAKRVFMKLMYKIGIPVNKIVKLSGVSRATFYRHIN